MDKGHLPAVTGALPPTSTVLVKAFALRRLKDRWSEYRARTDPRNGPLDPVSVLHSAGEVLAAVRDLLNG